MMCQFLMVYILVITVFVHFGVSDHRSKREGKTITKTIKMLFCVVKAKQLHFFFLFLLTRWVGFNTVMSTVDVEMLKTGYPREYNTIVGLLWIPGSFIMVFLTASNLKPGEAMKGSLRGFREYMIPVVF